MYKNLRIFLLSLLLPAFMASATGIQVTKHVCEQCQLVEFSLDGTPTGNCCGTAEVRSAEPASCCSTTAQKAVLPDSCCSDTEEPAGAAPSCSAPAVPAEGYILGSTCCQTISQFLIAEPTISSSPLLLVFYKAPLSHRVNPLALPEDDLFIAFEHTTPLWKDTGRELLLSIHQLKLDCLA